jgi:hypothetical protein
LHAVAAVISVPSSKAFACLQSTLLLGSLSVYSPRPLSVLASSCLSPTTCFCAGSSRAERPPPKIHHLEQPAAASDDGAFLVELSPKERAATTCYSQAARIPRTSSHVHARWDKPVAMDWDAKMLPAWDLGTVVGPSSSGGGGVGSGGGGALDLKLGAPTSSRAVATAAAAVGAAPTLPSANHPPPLAPAPAPAPSSSAPAKRPRPGHAQQAVPACSVQGCDADLSRCRDYHRRHKVCEAHSKTPVVTVAGQQQRFCQQCSRYACLPSSPPVVSCPCRAAYGRTPLRPSARPCILFFGLWIPFPSSRCPPTPSS